MAPLEPGGYTSIEARLLQALAWIDVEQMDKRIRRQDGWITFLLFALGVQYLMLAAHILITW